MGLLQVSVLGLQSQSHNRQQSNIAYVIQDHLVPATEGMLWEKSFFHRFLHLPTALCHPQADKHQTTRQTAELGQEGCRSAAGNSCNCNS